MSVNILNSFYKQLRERRKRSLDMESSHWSKPIENTFDAEVGVETEITLSEWVEFAIKIPMEGEARPFSFSGRRYLRPIYDTAAKRLLLKFGRQSEKSTLLGCRIIASMCIHPHYRALYVSPTQEQTKQFRRDRIVEPFLLSDILQAFKHAEFDDNIAILKLVNHSQVLFRYAFLTADRVRGVSVDAIYIDEIQDVLLENIPVIEECASHGNPAYRGFVYSGTPKSMENPIEHFWDRSTKNEWAVPSDGKKTFLISSGEAKKREHRVWNVALDESNIGKEGLICRETGVRIDPAHPDAQWVSTNPAARQLPDPIEAYRVPQIMVPWVEWKDILFKQHTYPRWQFYNEVLALPYDSGVRPLTHQDLLNVSSPDVMLVRDWRALRSLLRDTEVFFGIDWGTAENSYTVMTMGAYLPDYGHGDKFVFFYFRRFSGADSDPEYTLSEIQRAIEVFEPRFVGVDYGGGFDRNTKLIRKFGTKRIVRYQYLNSFSGTRPKLVYDSVKGRFMVERTEVLTDFFTAIKEEKLVFPRWEDWGDDYGKDFLSISSEYNEVLKQVRYVRRPDQPDDAVHASLYCLLTSMLVRKRPDILRPKKEERL